MAEERQIGVIGAPTVLRVKPRRCRNTQPNHQQRGRPADVEPGTGSCPSWPWSPVADVVDGCTHDADDVAGRVRLLPRYRSGCEPAPPVGRVQARTLFCSGCADLTEAGRSSGEIRLPDYAVPFSVERAAAGRRPDRERSGVDPCKGVPDPTPIQLEREGGASMPTGSRRGRPGTGTVVTVAQLWRDGRLAAR